MFPFRGDHYVADLEPASQLGLQTEVDLVSGLAATHDWFRENRELYPSYTITEPGKVLLDWLKVNSTLGFQASRSFLSPRDQFVGSLVECLGSLSFQ